MPKRKSQRSCLELERSLKKMSPQNAKQNAREMQQTKRLLWNIQSKTPGIFHVFFSVSGASFQRSKLVGKHTRSLSITGKVRVPPTSPAPQWELHPDPANLDTHDAWQHTEELHCQAMCNSPKDVGSVLPLNVITVITTLRIRCWVVVSLAHAHLFLLVFRFGLRIAVRGRPGYTGYIWMTPFLIILLTGKNLCVSSEGAAGSIEFWNVWLDTSVCGTLRWKPRHST